MVVKIPKVISVFGTRPEATKMAPLVKALSRETPAIESKVLITAQHREMLDRVKDFDVRPTDLDVMQRTRLSPRPLNECCAA